MLITTNTGSGVNSAAVSYRLINAGQIRHIRDYFNKEFLAFWLDKPTLEKESNKWA